MEIAKKARMERADARSGLTIPNTRMIIPEILDNNNNISESTTQAIARVTGPARRSEKDIPSGVLILRLFISREIMVL
jgi:hypothetical protein